MYYFCSLSFLFTDQLDGRDDRWEQIVEMEMFKYYIYKHIMCMTYVYGYTY